MNFSHYSNSNTIFTSLPIEYIQAHVARVKNAWQVRWDKVLAQKGSFAPYYPKSVEEIYEEFGKLNDFRQCLWYRDPAANPRVTQEEYMPAQDLLERAIYRKIKNIAFAYNNTSKFYNASTILIRDHHFIALQEPSAITLDLFFTLLVNNHVCALVRVKSDKEVMGPDSINYWTNNMIEEEPHSTLKIAIKEGQDAVSPLYLPYFYTNDWGDDKALDISTLFQIVNQLRQAYTSFLRKGPIACHCASGVGRTGTFIAAYILADAIHRTKKAPLSIEQVVLELSIQRPNLVGTVEQYHSLYLFVEYCLSQPSLLTS